MSSDSPRGPHSKTVYFWHYVPTCGASTELMSTCFTYESGTLNDTKTLLYHICQFDLDDVTLDEKGFFSSAIFNNRGLASQCAKLRNLVINGF